MKTGCNPGCQENRKVSGSPPDAGLRNPMFINNSPVSKEDSVCGIVGYIGEKDATPIILNGLKKLEYRGYDSAGLADA